MSETVLPRIGVAALATFVGIVVLEHFLEPGLAPTQHEISEYVNTSMGALMIVGFIVWATSLGATAALARGHVALTALLVIAMAGVIITACFATQTSAGVLPPGVRLSTSGRLHDLGSGALTLALLAATITSIKVVASPSKFRLRAVVLLSIAICSDVTLLAIGDPTPGIRQRILVVAGCIWQLMLLDALGRHRSGDDLDHDSESAATVSRVTDATVQVRNMSR